MPRFPPPPGHHRNVVHHESGHIRDPPRPPGVSLLCPPSIPSPRPHPGGELTPTSRLLRTSPSSPCTHPAPVSPARADVARAAPACPPLLSTAASPGSQVPEVGEGQVLDPSVRGVRCTMDGSVGHPPNALGPEGELARHPLPQVKRAGVGQSDPAPTPLPAASGCHDRPRRRLSLSGHSLMPGTPERGPHRRCGPANGRRRYCNYSA